jgi:gliding motility-associated-like protein
MKPFKNFLIIVCMLATAVGANSQYTLNGSASPINCRCYTLTPPVNTQAGSVWNNNKINLNQPFDYGFDVYFGCTDAQGADGIAFILQPISTSIGFTGSGLGFSGITPSVGVLMDTYQNTDESDPAFDHISINKNGNVFHNTPNNLAGPVQLKNGFDNVEDCQWHVLRVVWDPATFTLSTYFDGQLRLQTVVDMVNGVFGGDPNVFWGFSASTGGLNNEQKFCTRLNAGFVTGFINDAVCLGQAMTFNPSVDAFVPITGYYWNFGDGTTANVLNPPPHLYPTTGPYVVRFAITGIDGCTSDTAIATVHVGAKPTTDFTFSEACEGKPISFQSTSNCQYGTVNQFTWLANNIPFGNNAPNPAPANLPAGLVTVKLAVGTNYGCKSDTVTKTVNVYPQPEIDALVDDGCVDDLLVFGGTQIDAQSTITSWKWLLNDGRGAVTKDTQFSFGTAGNYTARLVAESDKGCVSDTAVESFIVNKAVAFAGNDTIVEVNKPFQLKAGGNGISFNWSPATVLNNPALQQPTATLADEQLFMLEIETAEGCKATDEVLVKTFKGSEVYVPTGFTPNGDGRNDLLKPLYIGIKKIDYFTIYNRWGQIIYRTTNMQDGWDGRFDFKNQPAGTYVWLVKATGLQGKEIFVKGTTLLIR